MDASRDLRRSLTVSARLCLSMLVLASLVASSVLTAAAADEPVPPPGLTVTPRALLGGHVRPGAWAAIDVEVVNDGPSISGELRMRNPQAGRSVYGTAVELPNGSRKRFILYAQPPLFGTRLQVDLVSGGRIVLSQDVPIKSHDAYAPIYAIVAERPEGLEAGVREAGHNPNGQAANVVTLSIADLPERVEAWSAIDRLVWQDVDAALLSSGQLEALRLWLTAGGRLIIAGGTTGAGTITGFPPDLLPFVPSGTVDVPANELSALVGLLPAGTTSVPALGGTLQRGAVWARSGEQVVAAQAGVGSGSVALVGFNPAEPSLAGPAGRLLWARLLPTGGGTQLNPLSVVDDSSLVAALNNLPAIDLPPIEQLFLLLFAYVGLIGPVNYLVLRRLDRREWAWVTMPLLVGIFAVVSYGMGASLKGSDVIVNEVAVVRAGQGSDRGLAQVYVGVFSPARRTFDVRIPGGALLSNPQSQMQSGQTEQPLDVLFGDPSRLRNFEVGFGVLRGFRAQAATHAPLVEADLHLARGRLEGSVTNRSEMALENVALTYAGGIAVLPSLGAGETQSVALDTSTTLSSYEVSERIFGSTFPRDVAQARVVYTRRTVIDQLANYAPGTFGGVAGGPLLLAWHPGQVLDLELVGEQPNRVGDSLFLVPLSMTVDREQVFNDHLMVETVIDNSTGDGFAESGNYYLGRGTMSIEVRPQGVQGTFTIGALHMALSQGDIISLRGNGDTVSPLPDAQQPDQDDPVGEPGAGDDDQESLPDLQLFDHAAGRWLEFPRFVSGRPHQISEPERFVDGSGRLMVRLVNRSEAGEQKYVQLLVRMEGTVD